MQCSKIRPDEVPDGARSRGQAATAPCGFTHRRSRAIIHLICLQLTDPKSNLFSHFRSIASRSP